MYICVYVCVYVCLCVCLYVCVCAQWLNEVERVEAVRMQRRG